MPPKCHSRLPANQCHRRQFIGKRSAIGHCRFVSTHGDCRLSGSHQITLLAAAEACTLLGCSKQIDRLQISRCSLDKQRTAQQSTPLLPALLAAEKSGDHFRDRSKQIEQGKRTRLTEEPESGSALFYIGVSLCITDRDAQ